MRDINGQSLEESVVKALDGMDTELFPYLPYILQDLWEIGASPPAILALIKKHVRHDARLDILDLGCGKGAVSIELARALNCSCYGIDAVREFIEEARQKAKAYGVAERCRFETGDIRTHGFGGTKYDLIILGAIGPVLGDYHATLSALSAHLKAHGAIIIEDAYIEDDSDYAHATVEKKSSILKQIRQAGMILADEHFDQGNDQKESDDAMFKAIKRRCHELMKAYPKKRALFENYISKQREENDVLENKVRCATLLIKADSSAT